MDDNNILDPVVFVEIEYEDGATARWALSPDDPRIERVEELLGHPNTITP
jgi:hypothetical protein